MPPRPRPADRPDRLDTAPLPSLRDIVHGVTATHTGGGWLLRFGVEGHASVVDRLADAEPAARRLVAGSLGLPAGSVRVRIVPDGATVAALRRVAGRRPWRRATSGEV